MVEFLDKAGAPHKVYSDFSLHHTGPSCSKSNSYSISGKWYCTRSLNHEGPHEADGGGYLVSRWYTDSTQIDGKYSK